jgi:hypothetical protein
MGFRDADSVGRYCNLDVFFPIGHRQGLDTSKETLNRTAERVPDECSCRSLSDRGVKSGLVAADGSGPTPCATPPHHWPSSASVVAVARLLGHESPATTLNHYAGLFPTDLDDIASRLDAAARLTIARQRESSDAKQSPTKHRPDEAETVGLSQS